MVSQRQMILPYSGLFLMSFSRSSDGNSKGLTTSLQIPFQVSFCFKDSFSDKSEAMYSPIAGQAVSPGDSIPTQSKKPGQPSASSRINSPPSSCARRPEKPVITCFNGKPLTFLAEPSCTLTSPSAVTGASSLLSTSTAVGPTMVLP